jgi:hypothetical protein
VLTAHTAMHRAFELESFVAQATASAPTTPPPRAADITPRMNTDQRHG